MILAVLDQIQDSPIRGLVTLAAFLLALLVGFTFHEFSHALSANGLGDRTAKRAGRLSLNPLAHLDPLGTAMIIFAGFGWAKPVPVNASYMRVGPRTGMALVAAAGPLANIFMATAAAMPINLSLVGQDGASLTFSGQIGDLAGFFLLSVVYWNLLLAAFNLIPLVPLDGFNVAVGILPREAANWFAQLERFGPAPLVLLVMLGLLLPGPGLFSAVIRPMIDAMASIILP